MRWRSLVSRLGDAQDQLGGPLAVDRRGNVWVAGNGNVGLISVGGASISALSYLIEFDAAGKYVTHHPLVSTAGSLNVMGVATDSADSVVVAVLFDRNVDFGSGPISTATDGAVGSGDDIGLAKYDAGGTLLWTAHLAGRAFDCPGYASGGLLAITPDDTIVVADTARSTATIDAASIAPAPVSSSVSTPRVVTLGTRRFTRVR